MILVPGIGGLLKLPDTGHQLYVRPGDAVSFLAELTSESQRRPNSLRVVD
jgi:hypothetical protein